MLFYIVLKIFRKLDEGPQGVWMGPKGPTDEAEGCNPPQEVEKAQKAVYFSTQW